MELDWTKGYFTKSGETLNSAEASTKTIGEPIAQQAGGAHSYMAKKQDWYCKVTTFEDDTTEENALDVSCPKETGLVFLSQVLCGDGHLILTCSDFRCATRGSSEDQRCGTTTSV